MLEARLAKVNMHVDETRRDDLAGDIQNLIRLAATAADPRDHAVFDQQIASRVEAGSGIDDASIAKQ
jgi:hypothetical protein